MRLSEREVCSEAMFNLNTYLIRITSKRNINKRAAYTSSMCAKEWRERERERKWTRERELWDCTAMGLLLLRCSRLLLLLPAQSSRLRFYTDERASQLVCRPTKRTVLWIEMHHLCNYQLSCIERCWKRITKQAREKVKTMTKNNITLLVQGSLFYFCQNGVRSLSLSRWIRRPRCKGTELSFYRKRTDLPFLSLCVP